MTNRDQVKTDEMHKITNRYRRRWDIENKYKTVKQFLPKTSSTDYRLRFLGFTLSAILYNLWRLTDYLITVGLGNELRSPPEIAAKVFANVFGEFVRRVT